MSRLSDSHQTLNSSKEDKFMGAIKFENVTYAHDVNSKVILNNVSFEIQPGEFIGIIGVSGAGKSTLLDLITGIRKPNTGTATIDQKDPRQVVNEFPGSIAFVAQNTFIKDASLEDNVRFNANCEDIDSRNFKKVLKETNLENLYLSVRDKNSLGESGKNLSGGEKQRIGIARGLYTNPKLMLLDEPTSALDSENEALVSESIKALKGKATVLFISHDYRVLEKADRILRIHDGNLEILTDDERKSLAQIDIP
jgi:ABC-type bacteriocin/lantibiotic exporter with double-glycine peptidase domain